MMDMSKQLPSGMALDKVDDNIMTLNVGPQHPGSGHMRLIVKIDGDYIVSCDPDPGYVHRGEEKMAEYRNYITNIPHLERPVIHDSCNVLYPYCLGVEDLLGRLPSISGKICTAICSHFVPQRAPLHQRGIVLPPNRPYLFQISARVALMLPLFFLASVRSISDRFPCLHSFYFFLQKHASLYQSLWSWGASWNVHVHRQHTIYSRQHVV